MFQRGCLAEGPHLAPAHTPHPGSWPPASFMRSSFPGRPKHLPPCCGCDFTVAFSSPACVSHRGCFHFYSRKKTIPGALAAARAQCSPPPPPPRRELCNVRCSGGGVQVPRCQPWS